MLLWAGAEEYPELTLAGPHDDPLFPADTVGALIGAVAATLAETAPELREAAAGFGAALDGLAASGAVAPPVQRLAVCDHLPAAIAASRDSPTRALAEAAHRLGAVACWTQNPNYRRQPPDPGFLANYGYFVVAGPADGPPAFVEAPGLSMGFLLLGPGTHYPLHRHPAEEIYIPLSGDGEWQRGEAAWRREPPGSVIHHPPGIPHATRAGTTPLLALYLWRGALATHARLG